jgi:hypothetical protein
MEPTEGVDAPAYLKEVQKKEQEREKKVAEDKKEADALRAEIEKALETPDKGAATVRGQQEQTPEEIAQELTEARTIKSDVDLYKENLLNLLTNIAQRRHRIKGKMVTREAAREAKETESLVRAKMEKTLSRLEALAQEFTAKGAQRRLTSRGRQQMDVVRRGLANVIPADARTLTYAEWETAVDAARIFLNATRHGDTGGLPQVIDAGVIAEVYEQVAPEGLTTQEILQQLEAVTGRSAEIAKLEGRVKAGLDTPEGRAEYRRKQQERSRLKLPAKTAKEMPSKAEERLAQRAEERERAEHRLETVLKDFETSVMLDKEQKAREARLESQNADLQKELDDLVAQNEGLKESRLADEIRKLEAIVQKTERESIERSLAPEEPVVEAPACSCSACSTDRDQHSYRRAEG